MPAVLVSSEVRRGVPACGRQYSLRSKELREIWSRGRESLAVEVSRQSRAIQPKSGTCEALVRTGWVRYWAKASSSTGSMASYRLYS